jgi:uncharacterized protein YjbI with pentapeptide repeats
VADDEDVDRLRRGERDLSHGDFRHADVSGLNLSDRIFGGSDFTGANFEGADLSRVDLRAAKTILAKFRRAVLKNAIFKQVVRCDFTGADLRQASFANAFCSDAIFDGSDLRGADFKKARLTDASFDGAVVDELTDFEGASGTRALGRTEAFAHFEFQNGIYKRKSQAATGTSVAIDPPSGDTAGTSFQGNAFQGGAFGVQNAEPPQVAGGAIGSDAIDDSAIGGVPVALTAVSIAQRIAADPDLYANLATNAAQQVRAAIGTLDSQKPNEPDALSGYERVNDVLTNLATDLETIASRIELAGTEVVPEAKSARLREVGDIFLKTYDGFVGWFGEHATIAGRVIAHVGLAGTISGALSYFAGVPPMIAFPITIGALNGENIWEVIKLFAPKGKDGDKNKKPPA